MFVHQGFSLRSSLTKLGVSSEAILREHLNLAKLMLDHGVISSLKDYRINTNDPNQSPHKVLKAA